VTTDVDPAVKEGSYAATSRKYTISTAQIVRAWDFITKHNPTNDPTIKPMPTRYNAELVKQLSPEI